MILINSFQINLSYPLLFVLFCLLLGALYAGGLYYRERRIREDFGKSRFVVGLLALFRFVTVSLIAFLLLSPFVKTTVTEEEKPVIAIAADNSVSAGNFSDPKDSIAFINKLNELKKDLQQNYDVDFISFGSEISEKDELDFKSQATDISELFRYINDRYYKRNLGGVILATDGIYNQGVNPVYMTGQIQRPVYTVALGDTTPEKDLLIRKIFYNRIVYAGDKFEVNIDIKGLKLIGESSELIVMKKTTGKKPVILKSEPFTINEEQFEKKLSIILESGEPGVHHYIFRVRPAEGEKTLINNTYEIFVDVLESRKKVLIAANAPHPDIAALKAIIDKNKNYETDIVFAGEEIKNVKQYHLMIFHQLPSRKHPSLSLIEKAEEQKVPLWYITGAQTNIALFNRSQDLLHVTNSNGQINEVQALINQDFTLFTLKDPMLEQIPAFPPLKTPYGQFKASSAAHTLLWQKVSSVSTEYPLLVFGSESGVKKAVFTGEGIWRWRLYDYHRNKDHEASSALISKSIQYLTVKEDKRKFRVTMPQKQLYENDPVKFDAELYNESYELINDPEVKVIIRNEEGEEFPFTFDRTGKAYYLNAGHLPPGRYTYIAKAMIQGDPLTAEGIFTISPLQLEMMQTVADHQLLRTISTQTGGEFLYPEEMSQLISKIKSESAVKPVLYDTYRSFPLINLKFLFFILLAFLSIEWYIRKWSGGY